MNKERYLKLKKDFILKTRITDEQAIQLTTL